MTKPTNLFRWSTNASTTLEPAETDKDKGFAVNDRPPARWLNWLWNGAYQWASYLNNLHGETEFLNKTYAWTGGHTFGGTLDLGAYAGQQALANWELRAAPSAYTADFYGVCYGVTAGRDQVWVAVGANDRVCFSRDARGWLNGTGTTGAGNFLAVAASNTGTVRFVAVGELGSGDPTPKIYSSNDGSSWTVRTPGGTPAGSLHAVAYGNGLWVAVGNSGEIQTSPDGVTWTKRTAAAADNLGGIAYGGGLWVAVGGITTTPKIQTSPNGITWTTRTPAAATGGLTAIVYGNSEFVAVGVSANVGQVQSSPDGITWTKRADLGNYPPQGITYMAGCYAVCTDNGKASPALNHAAVLVARKDALDSPWSFVHAPHASEQANGTSGTLWAITNNGKKACTVGSYGTLSDSRSTP
jgi:hypothetical protein